MGDELELNPSSSADNAVHRGITLVKAQSSVFVAGGNNTAPIMVITKDTRARYGIVPADWALVVRASA